MPGSASDGMAAGTSGALSYRPEVDGLRAIAVLAVVFYHAHLGITGGFVGVDLFFVISGYLITSLILRDLEKGSFSLADFWERRVRRIFPALGVMVLLTLLLGGGMFFISIERYADLGKSAVAQVFMMSNIYFWRTIGYFTGSAEEKPLMHTWSLAVEEQFYLLVPIILLVLFRFWRDRPDRKMLLFKLFSWGIAGSLAFSAIMLSSRDAGFAFYLLPTRAWELLCGSLLSVMPSALHPRRRIVGEVISWIGLAAILGSVFYYRKDMVFPGPAALLPCLGAAFVILGTNTREGGLPIVGRILSWKPMVFIGLISYSLYLWHWPLLVYFDLWSFAGKSSIQARAGVIVLAFVLALLSWRYVETPFRKKRLAKSRRAIFAFGLATSAVVLLLGFALIQIGHYPALFPKVVYANKLASQDKGIRLSTKIADVKAGRGYRFGFQDHRETPADLLVWGDSHAMQTLVAFDGLCREYRLKGVAFASSSTTPLLGAGYSPEQARRADLADAIVEYIRQNRIRHIVLAARWERDEAINPTLFLEAMTRTVAALRELDCTVWVVMSVPTPGIYVTSYIVRKSVFSVSDPFTMPDMETHRRRNEPLYQAARELDAHFIDPAPVFLDKDTGTFRYEVDGISLYWDRSHITSRAARMFLEPLFRREMSAVWKRSPALQEISQHQ